MKMISIPKVKWFANRKYFLYISIIPYIDKRIKRLNVDAYNRLDVVLFLLFPCFIVCMFSRFLMKKIHKKYYLSISLGALGVIALFLYAMIVYFPQRNTQGTPINEADLAHVRNMDIQALRSFSGDYIVSTNTIKAFEKFYAQTHDQKVAVSLLEMYISHYRFDDAFELIKNIYHNDIDFSIVPAPTFLYILFNSAQLSPSNYDLIHSILDDYKTHGRIDADTYTFYNGLLTLYAGDTTGFYHTITNLSGSQEYQSIVSSIQNATKTSDDLGAHISYYVD